MQHFSNPYNKIYKTSLLKENSILFPEGLIFEDEKFFFDTYLRAKRVSIVDEFLYYYRVSERDPLLTSPRKMTTQTSSQFPSRFAKHSNKPTTMKITNTC